jgi:hypothetical protein
MALRFSRQYLLDAREAANDMIWAGLEFFLFILILSWLPFARKPSRLHPLQFFPFGRIVTRHLFGARAQTPANERPAA